MTAGTDPRAALREQRRRLSERPGDPAILSALFAALDALGEAGTPEEAVARSNFGEALRRQGRAAEAEAHHRRAVAWLPGFGGNHFNLGVTLQTLGRTGEAAEAYGEAARLMPSFAGAACNEGAMLRALGRWDEAEAALRRALATDRGLAAGWLNLAAVRRDRGDGEGAVRGFRNTLALRPDLAEAHANLALALKETERIPESLPGFERALRLGLSDAGGVLAQLVQQRRHLARWDGLDELSGRLIAAVRDGRTEQVHPWIFLGEGAGPTLERACAERYSAWRTRGIRPAFPSRRERGERLRVGYLSADYHEHATAVLIAELIERHDRDRFTIVGLSHGADDGGPMRARLRRGFDRFIDLSALSDGDAARRIHGEGIDLLVDLKGHTQNARPGIAAHRPAPVQAQWLGYPGSVGAGFIDYVIADATVAPFDRQADYSERIVQLPGSYQPNDRTRAIGPTPGRAACGLPEDGVVFCCFNAAYKIGPELFGRWCRLLDAVPGSVLWLLASHPEVPGNLRREAAARGVAPDRLVFAPRLPGPDHLARYRLADLFLDTGPVGAHTTAGEALWAGLPVLTMLGGGFAARVGASLLRAVGLPDLVAESWEAYEAMALDLARRPEALEALRSRLAANRVAAPLFDSARFARGLESAFTTMWDIHARGEAPRSFAVPG
ncbi:putative O-linked N-acetylglucosamine transferase (SPINDLY family) [Azospirillum agricola]|uniref:O-linked N-acetylglucosamine transferase, SPINDLY family protein n=1 Tax=Azospirillum agricola TaxID=1720247 RepID=UPI001AE99788|nr:tetratricopeptide repeat protein [Azospirillum agricola]MBP2227278.1 putative O-linked N-acetylglucosamine transferase (SPINDLY family) [Azospirillum agricola]